MLTPVRAFTIPALVLVESMVISKLFNVAIQAFSTESLNAVNSMLFILWF